MNNIDLSSLYPLQKALDEDIAKRHNVTYETTSSRRLLALLVEIGELANETRAFKYWSNKPSSPKEVILEEYSDGMHFFLSLGIPLQVKQMIYELTCPTKDVSNCILDIYNLIIDFKNHNDEEHYIVAFQAFLNLMLKLDLTPDEVISSYKSKLNINYQRQETNY